jgi:predicted kinase
MKKYSDFITESSEEGITVWMPVGIQGSGKSTWVKNNNDQLGNHAYINADSYREDLQRDMQKTNPKWKFRHTDGASQQKVFSRVDDEVRKAIENNKNIVLDMMSLTPKNRKTYITKIKALAKSKPVKFIAVYFPANVEKSIERISKSRKEGDINYVTGEIIKGAAERLVSPSKEEGFDKILTVNY